MIEQKGHMSDGQDTTQNLQQGKTMITAQVVAELMRAGVTGDALVDALRRIEMASTVTRETHSVTGETGKETDETPTVTPGALRQRRWREAERRRKALANTTEPSPPPSSETLRETGDIEIIPDLKPFEVGKESVNARATPSPNRFPELWGVYPRRAGTNSRKKAEQIYTRNVAKGVPEQEMIDGARRYAVFCDTEGKTGTQFVMQTTTWLNREEWHNDFTPSRKTGLNAHFDDLRAGLERNRDPDDGAGRLEPPDETGLPF